MEPAIEAGDIVIYRPIKTGQLRLEKGCIVIAKHPLKIKTSIIKRVIRATSLGVELRGDNEGSSTDSRHFGVINSQDILGIVEEIIPINF